MKAPKRARWRGARRGICNICGNPGPLTDDHVPPTGSVEPTARDLANLTHYLGQEMVKPVLMQSGIKFRSLCRRCNVELLGSQYDPHLNALSKKAASLLRAARYLAVSDKTVLRVRPQRIARAIIGHLLAVEIRDNMATAPMSAPFQDTLRKYFLDPSASLPCSVDVRYWVYSEDAQVIIRGFGIGSIRRKGILVCDLIKYFPLAFLVIFEPDPQLALRPHALMPDRALDLDDEVDLVLELAARPRTGWPEQPDDDEFVLFNDSMAYIAPATARGQTYT